MKQLKEFSAALERMTGLAADAWEALAIICRAVQPAAYTLGDQAWADLRTLDWATLDEFGDIVATDGGHIAMEAARKALAALIALAAVKEAAKLARRGIRRG